MDRFLNFTILSNPMNWVIIILILYLTALLAKIVYNAAGSAPIQIPGLLGDTNTA